MGNRRSDVTRVQTWNSPDSTRVIVTLNDTIKYESARIASPDRIYFNLYKANVGAKLSRQELEVNDGLLRIGARGAEQAGRRAPRPQCERRKGLFGVSARQSLPPGHRHSFARREHREIFARASGASRLACGDRVCIWLFHRSSADACGYGAIDCRDGSRSRASCSKSYREKDARQNLKRNPLRVRLRRPLKPPRLSQQT